MQIVMDGMREVAELFGDSFCKYSNLSDGILDLCFSLNLVKVSGVLMLVDYWALLQNSGKAER